MKAHAKSTVEEIRQRFDGDVERFSNLATGQTATMDAAECMELISDAAAASTSDARTALDVGCGAGNYSLKLRERLPGVRFTLLDLSRPMLDRARERLGPSAEAAVQGDIREACFEPGSFEIILAAAVLHHLRSPEEWRTVFGNFFRWLKPGGGLWIFDLTIHEAAPVERLMRGRYARYLERQGGPAYREKVFAYIEKEDTPASLPHQLALMRDVGFAPIDVLHKNAGFAAFGGIKPEKREC